MAARDNAVKLEMENKTSRMEEPSINNHNDFACIPLLTAHLVMAGNKSPCFLTRKGWSSTISDIFLHGLFWNHPNPKNTKCWKHSLAANDHQFGGRWLFTAQHHLSTLNYHQTLRPRNDQIRHVGHVHGSLASDTQRLWMGRQEVHEIAAIGLGGFINTAVEPWRHWDLTKVGWWFRQQEMINGSGFVLQQVCSLQIIWVSYGFLSICPSSKFIEDFQRLQNMSHFRWNHQVINN